MWPFKSKYDKLKREDVVSAIIDLEKQESDMEQSIIAKTQEIDELMKKGREEKNRELKLLWAKKINHLKEEKESDVKRSMYLLYNIRMMKKLKDSIDDNQFFVNTGNVSLGNLLRDQKGLAKFLNKALGTRVKAEDVLTSADETFAEIQGSYEENETIYGMNSNDDKLLAMFETEEQVEEEEAMFSQNQVKKDETDN